MNGRHTDSRHPSEELLADELEKDRRGEYALIWKTVVALAICGALVVIRQVFFV